jgi:hypothetical protein
MANEQSWELDPSKFLKKLDLELSAETMEKLRTTAQRTGRSEDELILEILDQALQRPQPSENSGQNRPESHPG